MACKSAEPGRIRRMGITAAHDYDLGGEFVDTPEEPVAPLRANPFPIRAASSRSRLGNRY
jgi:hypothetical protein